MHDVTNLVNGLRGYIRIRLADQRPDFRQPLLDLRHHFVAPQPRWTCGRADGRSNPAARAGAGARRCPSCNCGSPPGPAPRSRAASRRARRAAPAPRRAARPSPASRPSARRPAPGGTRGQSFLSANSMIALLRATTALRTPSAAERSSTVLADLFDLLGILRLDRDEPLGDHVPQQQRRLRRERRERPAYPSAGHRASSASPACPAPRIPRSAPARSRPRPASPAAAACPRRCAVSAPAPCARGESGAARRKQRSGRPGGGEQKRRGASWDQGRGAVPVGLVEGSSLTNRGPSKD